jgi:hypothetical protein
MSEQTAICPECDNVIELEEEVQVGDIVSCTNFPCMWEGVVDEISNGNVWFEEPEKEE